MNACRKLRVWIGPFVLASLMSTANAGQVTGLWGEYKGDHNWTLAYQADPIWQHAFVGSRVDLSLEYSLGRATTRATPDNQALWHVGVTPIARWWFTPQTGVEVGIGANLFSGTRLGSKRISTAFQFGDSIGVFHRFASTPWTLGLRLTHYSNADIKRPNPGQDYVQLRASYEFN